MSGFFGELKRRRVVRVALVYGAAAYAAIEVTDVLTSALRMPAIVTTIVAIAALAGIPVALLLAWLFDITPDGIRRARKADPSPVPERAGWLSARTAAVVAVLIAIAAAGGWLAGRMTAGDAEAQRSIAVLPFVDMSPEHDLEYFGDGMAEEILNALAGMPDLKVAGRTSSFSFKGRDADLRTIGEALGVGTVLEGSVRRSGSRLRVTAQLVRTQDQFHLWSEVFERNFDEDIFDIQDAIAAAIVDALQLRFTGGGAAALAGRGTTDLEAYNAYLLGRFQWNKRSREGVSASIELFERATQRDPGFARAYAGLADAWSIMAFWYWAPADEAFPRARAAADRAIALDPRLAEGYIALAKILEAYDHDWDAAERAYRRGLELNPDLAYGRYWYSEMLDVTNRPDEAYREVTLARDLDPLALQIASGVGIHFRFRGQYEQAIEANRAVLAIDPAFAGAQWEIAQSLNMLGRHAQALDMLALYTGDEAMPLALRGWALAGAGQLDEGRRQLAAAAEPPSGAADHLTLALAYSFLGDVDAAFRILGRGVEARDPSIMYIGTLKRLDPRLGQDPRLDVLLRRMGLDRFW